MKHALVTFDSDADPVYAKNYYSLRENLETMLKREVDLIRDGVIRNPYRVMSIEQDKVDIYAA